MSEVRPIGSSFYWAMRIMPRDRRDAMYALYRYCRGLDDIADRPGPADEKLDQLALWREAVGGLFRGEDPEIPEIRTLAGPLHRFGLEQEPLSAVIRGMEMDVRGEMRAPSLEALQDYCYCVAGAVGLSSLQIFGAGDGSRRFAVALGEALQLTNILRDLDEDAARGRLYLPREFLAQAAVRSGEPGVVLRDPRLGHACDLLAALADQRYRDALAALPPDPRPLRPAMIMLAVYARLLQRLRGRGWPAADRARVPGAERLWLALRHLGPPSTWPISI